MNSTALQKILHQKYVEAQLKNPRLSKRAFALRLGVSSGALTELMNGKRKLSQKKLHDLADRLNLDPSEQTELFSVNSAPVRLVKRSGRKPTPYLQVSADQFKIISRWEHFAILSLIKIKNFDPDPTWIASRLNISRNSAERALERLLSTGLLRRTRSGGLKRGSPYYSTSDGVVDSAVRQSHLESLELARSSLATDGIQERDFTSITMAIDSKKLPEAKQLVREFHDRLANLLEDTTSPDRVYRLAVQLFPISKSCQ